MKGGWVCHQHCVQGRGDDCVTNIVFKGGRVGHQHCVQGRVNVSPILRSKEGGKITNTVSKRGGWVTIIVFKVGWVGHHYCVQERVGRSPILSLRESCSSPIMYPNGWVGNEHCVKVIESGWVQMNIIQWVLNTWLLSNALWIHYPVEFNTDSYVRTLMFVLTLM